MVNQLFHKALAVLSIVFISGCASVEKSIPLSQRKTGEVADSLAHKIMKAVNDEAWQNTGAVSWTFKSNHHHLWDKKRNYTKVEWDKYVVIFDIGTKHGKAWKEGKEISGEELKKLIDKAWKYWANDSFWLNPFSKLFDEGTTRAYVTKEDGNEALLITYNSGGVTPGDSYLWTVDSTGLPVKGNLWVSIFPFKGFPATWENWMELPTGAKIGSFHKLGFFKLSLTDIKGAATLSELVTKDPFENL